MLGNNEKTQEGYSKLITRVKGNIINYFDCNSDLISKFGFEQKLEEIVVNHKKQILQKTDSFNNINEGRRGQLKKNIFGSSFKSSFNHTDFQNFLERDDESNKENIFDFGNNDGRFQEERYKEKKNLTGDFAFGEAFQGIRGGNEKEDDDDEESIYEFDFDSPQDSFR